MEAKIAAIQIQFPNISFSNFIVIKKDMQHLGQNKYKGSYIKLNISNIMSINYLQTKILNYVPRWMYLDNRGG